MPVGFDDYSLESLTQLIGHITTGLTLGQLEDPYVISNTPDYAAGSIPAGTYHLAISSVDSTGESWTGDYTVVLTGIGQIISKWVPIWGADHYNVYLGPDFAHMSLQASVAGAASNTYTLTKYTAGTVVDTSINSSAGQPEANVVCTARVPGAPANFFLNLGTTTNSTSTFFFTNGDGIVAIFQNKAKSELDIALTNTGECQLYVVGNHELDFFINNTLACNFQAALCDFNVNTQFATPSVATAGGSFASPILALINSFWNGAAAVANEWKFLNNTSNQLEFDYNSTLMLVLDSTTGLTLNGSGSAGSITFSGTLTSTGAVAINAGGSNQNITLTPSGTGFTLLNGNVGIGTTGPNFPIDVTVNRGNTGSSVQVNAGASSGALHGIAGYNLRIDTTNLWQLLTDNNAAGVSQNGFFIQYNGNTAARYLTVLNNGNVGIGTSSPTSPLHVVGLPIYANNTAAIAGGLTAGAFYRTGADPDPVCVVH